MEVRPTHACEPILGFKCSAILPRPTEARRNLRHSERRERGGKVPEGLRLTGEGCNSRHLKDATADLGKVERSLVRINPAHHGEEVVEHRKNLGQILIHSLNAAGQNKYDRFTGYACNASAKKGVRLFCSVF